MKNKKSLGQNWLKERSALEAIAELAIDNVDLCVEIGPGLGTLTSSLLKRFKKVIAVEFDKTLATNLPKSFPGKNLEVINGDFLNYDLESIREPYVIAGNIPYYITTPIVEKVITAKNKPKRIVLLMQKEVAKKILSTKVGLPHTSLSLFVDNFAEVIPGPVISRDLFIPVPKVDSMVLTLIPRETPKAEDRILDFIHRCFANPRKKLSSNLASFTNLSKTEAEELLKSLKHDTNIRPSDLALEDYVMLAKSIKK